MADTQELSQKHRETLRRIAWALDQPIAATLEAVLDLVWKVADTKQICYSCRDKSFCQDCDFYKNYGNH
jgi:hypothetical protein